MLATLETARLALPTILRAIWANYRCWSAALVISGIYVGAAWHQTQSSIIPECAAGVDLGIDVQVLAAARKDTGFWTLDLLVLPHQPERLAQPVQSCGAEPCPSLIGKRLLLRWLSAADIQVHQTLTVKAKLRQPWGSANPGGFDYQRWLLASGYSATGYVREGIIPTTPNRLPLRYRWINQVRSLLQVRGLIKADILLALVTGDSNAVDAATWERHRRAGTIHLLVVSGLHVSVVTGFVALLAGFVALLPLSVYALVGAAVAALTLTLQTPAHVQPGQFWIRAVDAGQGSAAIVDTAGHRLLVDTGPRFGRSNWARSHVLPVLRSTGPHNIDQLLLSHNDAGHAGGVDFFRDYFAVFPFTGPESCTHQKSWLRDGVRFTTLQARGLRTDNDRSCTLLVETATQAAYLSGDISAQAERLLLNDLLQEITFLLSPHHGSATSSSIGFVRYLSPKIVVHSCGRRNRYGHPHPTVLRRYIWEESLQINTGASCAVQWCSNAPLKVITERR